MYVRLSVYLRICLSACHYVCSLKVRGVDGFDQAIGSSERILVVVPIESQLQRHLTADQRFDE